MDPGTLVSIASFGLRVSQSLLDYYAAWKDFDDDIRITYETITQLNATLATLEPILSSIDDRIKKQAETAVWNCKEYLLKLDKKTKKLQTYEKPVGFRQHFTQVLQKTWYPLKQDTLLKLRKIVGEVQNQLSLALQVLGLGVGLSSREPMNEITYEVQNINSKIAKISLQNEQTLSLLQIETLEKACQWLNAVEQESFYQRTLEWREEGTGTWLVNSSTYLEWRNGSQKHLWLYGKAGCGKTVASATIIQDIRKYCKDQNNIGYAMFYFAFDDASKQSYRDCLASIILQISGQSSTTQELLRAYTACDGSQKSASPGVDKLEQIFLAAIEPYAKFFLILDALDEAPEQHVGHQTIRQVLLSKLNDLSRKAPHLHILATSRELIDIQEQMKMLGAKPVSMHTEFVNEDIRSFVINQMATDHRLRKLSMGLKSRIENVLTEKADGMFRWVYCQLQELKKLRCLRASYIETILSNLPKTLDETYYRILHQIEPPLRDDAIVLLRWMAYAKRPLTLAELTDTVLIDLTTEYGSVATEDRGSVEDTLDILPGLIMIMDDHEASLALSTASHRGFQDRTYRNGPHTFDTMATKRVKLAHFSVKEYLESSRILDSNVRDFHLSRSIAEQFLADSCIVYLMHYASNYSEYKSANELMILPLLAYAVYYWNQHCQPDSDPRKQLLFLQSQADIDCWQHVYEKEPRYRLRIQLSHDIGMIRAGYFGLNSAWQQVYEKDPEYRLRFESSQDVGLIRASHFGLNSMMKELIAHGADIHVRSGLAHRYTLIMAASQGHEHTVRMLIEEYNADVMVTDEAGLKQPWTALHEAIEYRHEQVAILLLKKYMILKHLDKQYLGSVLYWASFRGSGQFIEALLDECDLDVDAYVIGWGNALHAAVSGKHEHIVRMLIDKYKANIDAQNDLGETALMHASVYGSLKMVKVLLECSANVYLLDRTGRNCLHHAARGEDDRFKMGRSRAQARILNVLFDAGKFDIYMEDKHHRTALDYARMANNSYIIHELVCKTRNSYHDYHSSWSPSQWACRSGSFKLLETLCDRDHLAWSILTDDPLVPWMPLDIAFGHENKSLVNSFHGLNNTHKWRSFRDGIVYSDGGSVCSNSSSSFNKGYRSNSCHSCRLEIHDTGFQY